MWNEHKKNWFAIDRIYRIWCRHTDICSSTYILSFTGCEFTKVVTSDCQLPNQSTSTRNSSPHQEQQQQQQQQHHHHVQMNRIATATLN